MREAERGLGRSISRRLRWKRRGVTASMYDGHVDIASSTWRVVKWVRWETNWASYGQISTLGPKAKLKPT